MSVQSDLASAFAEPELTVPVELGAATARGFYDEAGTTVPIAGAEIQLTGPTLFLVKGALSGLTAQVQLRLGAVGAATAAGGRLYTVHQVDPIQDGLVLACRIGGGR